MTGMLELPPILEATVLALVERDTSAPTPPPGSENWTLQDTLDYAGPLPENLATACATASHDVLGRIWK
ncbi:MAG: hypothetical protein JO250_20270 [Armatimonadetes bacterium]|nr:hypothetical protein [Armatimonadota bacterium]